MEILSRIAKLPAAQKLGELIDRFVAHFLRRIDDRLRRIDDRLNRIDDRLRPIDDRQDAVERLVVSTLLPPKEAGYDVIVTASEVSEKHGAGLLLRRAFDTCPQILSVRSADDFKGEKSFGEESFLVSHGWSSRPNWFAHTLQQLRGRVARRVICVPYQLDELKTAITLKEIYGAPICLWLMDDKSVTNHQIPYELMREFLGKCSLRLTTHAELRDAYERAFGFKFYLFPAVVSENLIVKEIRTPRGEFMAEKRGAIFGSISSRKLADKLMQTIKVSGLQCDWFENNHLPSFELSDSELTEAGVTRQGIIPEEELPGLLGRYPYLIVPTGDLDPDDPETPLARLNLPGRILFAMATSNTPFIVLGHPDTPAARFVRAFSSRLAVRL